MTTLIEFLAARIDEDEAAANLMAKYYPPPWDVYDRGWMARVYGPEPFWEVTRLEVGPWVDNDSPTLGEIIEHVALHDPARALREVAAKRAIVAVHPIGDRGYCTNCWADRTPQSTEAPCLTLRHLAAVHSDHEDYREEWRP